MFLQFPFFFFCLSPPSSDVIQKNEANPVYLDKLTVEKERGITVKAQTASMLHNYKGQQYLLNLIDTPARHDLTAELIRVTCFDMI